MSTYIYKSEVEKIESLNIDIKKVLAYKENITITLKGTDYELYPMCKKPSWEPWRGRPNMVYCYQTVEPYNGEYPLVDINMLCKVKKGEYVVTNQIDHIVLN